MVVQLHRLAKLYGQLPTDLLAMPVNEFNLLSLIAEIGVKQDNADLERSRKR